MIFLKKFKLIHVCFLILSVVLLKQGYCVSLRHQYWFAQWKQEIANPTKSAFDTKHWNYCDLKCFYLQNYHNEDFVVIEFQEQAYRPNFIACYVKTSGSLGQYTIWDKVTKNDFYQSACGMDMQDYLQSPKQYKIAKIQGEGRQFNTLPFYINDSQSKS